MWGQSYRDFASAGLAVVVRQPMLDLILTVYKDYHRLIS
jgi:hypothetical protein